MLYLNLFHLHRQTAVQRKIKQYEMIYIDLHSYKIQFMQELMKFTLTVKILKMH